MRHTNKHSSHLSCFSNSGFTLVELLIGIAISSMIIGATYGVYIATHDSWSKSRARSDNYQYARIAFQTMEKYLRSAIDPQGKEHIIFEGETRDIEGTTLQDDTLRFVSTGGTVIPGRRNKIDLCEVEFFLGQNEETRELFLMMRKKSLPGEDEIEEVKEAELALNVVSFNVEYYDGFEWVDEWLLEESLPKAVEINLILADQQDMKNILNVGKLIAINTR